VVLVSKLSVPSRRKICAPQASHTAVLVAQPANGVHSMDSSQLFFKKVNLDLLLTNGAKQSIPLFINLLFFSTAGFLFKYPLGMS
jgi:hypothetical protein